MCVKLLEKGNGPSEPFHLLLISGEVKSERVLALGQLEPCGGPICGSGKVRAREELFRMAPQRHRFGPRWHQIREGALAAGPVQYVTIRLWPRSGYRLEALSSGSKFGHGAGRERRPAGQWAPGHGRLVRLSVRQVG